MLIITTGVYSFLRGHVAALVLFSTKRVEGSLQPVQWGSEGPFGTD